MSKAAQFDGHQSIYVLCQMSAVYALLLNRLGARVIYPLSQVFPPK